MWPSAATSLLSAPGTGEIMDDFSAGHISTGEAREIIQQIGGILGNDEFHFSPG
jgi:2,3-bisphosphoglycerate-independent phosphoglycerate mutase